MKITAIKSRKVHAGELKIEDLLAESLENFAKNFGRKVREILPENSVVALSSKVVALCENRVESLKIDRDELVRRESEWFLPREFSRVNYGFSISQGTLIANAGIDQSNADGSYVLWPENCMESAEEIREFLSQKFSRKDLGVIITDSTVFPLRRGTVGIMVGYSGFRAINDWRGRADLFGRKFKVEVSNVANSLAAAANICMGEGDERTPFAIITETNFVKFTSRKPSAQEIADSFVSKDEDLFGAFFGLAKWKKGEKFSEKSNKIRSEYDEIRDEK